MKEIGDKRRDEEFDWHHYIICEKLSDLDLKKDTEKLNIDSYKQLIKERQIEKLISLSHAFLISGVTFLLTLIALR